MANPASMMGMMNPMTVQSQIVPPGANGQKKRFLQNRKFELHDLEKLKKEAAAKAEAEEEHEEHEEEEVAPMVQKKTVQKQQQQQQQSRANSKYPKTQNLMLNLIDRQQQQQEIESSIYLFIYSSSLMMQYITKILFIFLDEVDYSHVQDLE